MKKISKIFQVTIRIPLNLEPIIKETAKENKLPVSVFIRQIVYEALGIKPELKKKVAQTDRCDTTTVDAVLPKKNLTGV